MKISKILGKRYWLHWLNLLDQDITKVKESSQPSQQKELTLEEKLKVLDETIVLNENLESVGLGDYCFWDKESDRLLREAIIQSINLKTM